VKRGIVVYLYVLTSGVYVFVTILLEVPIILSVEVNLMRGGVGSQIVVPKDVAGSTMTTSDSVPIVVKIVAFYSSRRRVGDTPTTDSDSVAIPVQLAVVDVVMMYPYLSDAQPNSHPCVTAAMDFVVVDFCVDPSPNTGRASNRG
jgi:hypothetical protein